MRTQALWRTMVVTAGVACLAVAVGGGASAGVVSHWTFDADFTDATGAHHAFVGTGSPAITTADSVFGGGALALLARAARIYRQAVEGVADPPVLAVVHLVQ